MAQMQTLLIQEMFGHLLQRMIKVNIICTYHTR